MSRHDLQRPRVGVIEDSEIDLRAIGRHLRAAGVEWQPLLKPFEANEPEEVLERLTSFDPSVLVLDLAWSPEDEIVYQRLREAREGELERHLKEDTDLASVRLLHSLAALDPYLPVIVLSQFAYEPLLDCLRHSFPQIFWFLEKPRFEAAAMLVERTLRLRELELLRDAEETGLYGHSSVIRALRREVRHLAVRSEPILIRGEPGSGRTTVARALHALSGRSGEFASVDCAALTGEEALRALFGVGPSDPASACRRARGGTLLVEEIHRFPERFLPRLVAAWASGQAYPYGAHLPYPIGDLRWVATADRLTSIPSGLSLSPATVVLDIPPLRERTEDLEPLVFHFARRLGGSIPPGVDLFSDLEHVAQSGNESQLFAEVRHRLGVVPWTSDPSEATPRWSKPLDTILLEIERNLVSRALAEADGKVSVAAKLLGLTRDQLNYRLRHRFPELSGASNE